MALYGDLSDIALQDILAAIAQRTGVFLVGSDGQVEDAIHLSSGYLTAWMRQGGVLQDVLSIQERFRWLMHQGKGRFEFQASEQIARHFSLPLTQLIAAALSGLENGTLTDALLGSDFTIFEAKTALDVWMGNDLQHFWELTEKQLVEGASAQQLARQTGLPLKHVQLFLYKLRMAGVIAPRQAVSLHGSAHDPSRDKAPTRTIRRLSLENAHPPTEQSLLNVRVDQPEKSLLARILRTLTFRRLHRA